MHQFLLLIDSENEIFFLIIFSITTLSYPLEYGASEKGLSYNSFGQVGLIQTPSAESKPEGSISLTINKNDIWKFGTLSVSPFDWLEAGYFYYRPTDLRWEVDNIPGHYLDKGFNVKFIYRPENLHMPNFAIGLDDFAGTGYFTREYFVSTSKIQNTKYTLGIGWGKFNGINPIDNPLGQYSNYFNERPSVSENLSYGGSPSYDQWFRGKSSAFGGLEHKFENLKGLKLKIEYDPFDYFDFSANKRADASFKKRRRDSDINIGFSYPISKFFQIEASYLKGNTFNLSFTFALNFRDELYKKSEFKPEITKVDNYSNPQDEFYEDLLHNLNKNRLFLQTANLEKNSLDIAISTADHRNAIRSSSYASYIAKKVADLNEVELDIINISHINVGVELNEISYIENHFDEDLNSPIEVKRYHTEFNSVEPGNFKKNKFRPIVNFPVLFTSTSPTLKSHIGNPEKFYFGAISLTNTTEIQLSRNFLISTEVSHDVYNNISDTKTGPNSLMEHVRTDVVDYLKTEDFYITRMQIDYIWSPKREYYAKLSGGIYESMFGGVGAEFLYKPFDRRYSLGLELFHVKQRNFDQRFDFKEYHTTTGHFNILYNLPAGIEANLSFGRYLAKDDGYTLDLSRRTNSGFKAGIYFTRTNVSAEVFGEGSFDKGFYFQIPMDLFSSKYNGNYSTFKLSPLTRDGGAKLEQGNDLRGLIYNSTYLELHNQWSGYLD